MSGALAPSIVPGGDAGHHTRDGYAPRNLELANFECGTRVGEILTDDEYS